MQSPISLPPSSSSSSSSVSRPMPHSSMTIDVPSLAGRNTSTSMTMTAPHAYLPFQASSHRTTHFHPSQPSAMNQSLPPHPSHPSVTTLSHTIQHHPQGVMTTTTTTTHASYIPHQVPPHNMRYNHTTSMHSNAGVPSDKRTYNLTVVQQPVRARMCGFGEKDRRPVDPPPVVQLTVLNEAGHPDQEMERSPFFVVHVTLRPAEDPRFALDIIQLDSSGSGNTSNANSMPTNSTQVPQPGSSSTRRSSSGATGNTRTTTTTRVMMGTLVSSPSVLKDDKGNTGCFFCFPDLSIRCEGEYRLRFTLVKMNDDEEEEDDGCSGHTVAEVYSEPFTVYSAKRFPGMTESTQLSKAFARQGLKIPIRNDVRKRQGDNQ
ncbi:velvet factor-domain-containing protein [Syncephalis plumigaleata]|nr:velvet factor-domain-containing protein [Syncephalis plumigaleata]